MRYPFARVGLSLVSMVVLVGCPPPPAGSCCLDSNCFETTIEECAGEGGVYRGDGTECTPSTCEPSVTKCALIAIACFDGLASQPDDVSTLRITGRWPRNALTWRMIALRGQEEQHQLNECARALVAFAHAANLNFRFLESEDADITISFHAGDHGDPFPFEPDANDREPLGHAFFPGTFKGGEIHLNANADWTFVDPQGQIDLFTVLLHEIGHALGLEHDRTKGAVMGFGYPMGGVTGLADSDIEAIRRLYGSADGVIEPEAPFSPCSVPPPDLLTGELNPDLDGDGIPDSLEVLVFGTDPRRADTDGDGIDDFAELFVRCSSPVGRTDTDGDGLPDEAEVVIGTDLTKEDTDDDGLSDLLEVLFNTDPLLADTDGDGIPDADDPFPTVGIVIDPCRVGPDCNENGEPDQCDIDKEVSEDCNFNGSPDECELAAKDCNGTSVPDDCELLDNDCNRNGIPDECDTDCNRNEIPDDCDIASGFSEDCNENGIPDDCENDSDDDGCIDACDPCPNDPLKKEPGQCGCGVPESPCCPTCDDGVFCNGEETCVDSMCQLGVRPCDPAIEVCDEQNDVCICNIEPSSEFVLLVSGKFSDNVLAYDVLTGESRGDLLGPGDHGLDYANGIAVDSRGHVFVASVHTDSVLQISPISGALVREFTSPVLRTPSGVLIREPSTLLVASYVTDSIEAFDIDSGASLGTLVESCSGGLDGPGGLGWSSNGDLLVTSEKTDEVLAFDADTGAFLRIAAQDSQDCDLWLPTAVLLDTDDTFLVASFKTNAVVRFGPNGECLGEFIASGSGGLEGVQGLSWGPDGDLYVSSRKTNQVLKYCGQDGAFLGVFAADGNLDEPTYHAFLEVNNDCNENGVPDECDLAAGTSTDNNGNGILDICE